MLNKGGILVKTVLAVLVIAMSFSVSGYAEGIFGAAGNDRCGVGTKLFGSGSTITSQSSEESTDMASMDSISITTGTSGCSNSGIVKVPQKELFYANANYEELQVEMASGQGEALAALAETMGCPSADVGLFLQTSKEHYSQTFPSSSMNPLQMIINFRQGLKSNPILAQNCNSLNS
jgi:hypothetical protein